MMDMFKNVFFQLVEWFCEPLDACFDIILYDNIIWLS